MRCHPLLQPGRQRDCRPSRVQSSAPSGRGVSRAVLGNCSAGFAAVGTDFGHGAAAASDHRTEAFVWPNLKGHGLCTAVWQG